MMIIQVETILTSYLQSSPEDKEQLLIHQLEYLIEPLLKPYTHQDLLSIHNELLHYGLFPPEQVDTLITEANIDWSFIQSVVEQTLNQLSKQWQQPLPPTIILPANLDSHIITEQFHGVTGAIIDQILFIFVQPHHSIEHVKAVVIHEYSHYCRINQLKLDQLTLKDLIVLEGLAAVAVEHSLPHITDQFIYQKLTDDQFKYYWKKRFEPYLDYPITHPIIDQLMYGMDNNISFLGYQISLHLLKKGGEQSPRPFKEWLYLPTQTIIESAI